MLVTLKFLILLIVIMVYVIWVLTVSLGRGQVQEDVTVCPSRGVLSGCGPEAPRESTWDEEAGMGREES